MQLSSAPLLFGLALGACSDAASPGAASRSTAPGHTATETSSKTSSAALASSGTGDTRASPSASTPQPVGSAGARDFSLVRACVEQGAGLRKYQTDVDGTTGHIKVTEDERRAGEVTLMAGPTAEPGQQARLAATELASLAELIASPELASFFGATLSGSLQSPTSASEGTVCTLTLTQAGTTRAQKWSTRDELSAEQRGAVSRLEKELARLGGFAIEAIFGGPCASDADCHLAQGDDCSCTAAGPPPGSGWTSRCVAFPCKDDVRAACNTGSHRCFVTRK